MHDVDTTVRRTSRAQLRHMGDAMREHEVSDCEAAAEEEMVEEAQKAGALSLEETEKRAAMVEEAKANRASQAANQAQDSQSFFLRLPIAATQTQVNPAQVMMRRALLRRLRSASSLQIRQKEITPRLLRRLQKDQVRARLR